MVLEILCVFAGLQYSVGLCASFVEREMNNEKIRDIMSELKSHTEKAEETVICARFMAH